MSDEDVCTLESSDGQSFKVTVGVAKLNLTLLNLLEDSGIDAPIPLPNVSGSILAKVIEYSKYHYEHPTIQPVAAPSSGVPQQQEARRTDNLISWDIDFCKVDQQTLFELILAANYLDNKGLLDVVCKTVANLVKGKTPDEIRKTFRIDNDFTPEEEAQIRKENEWIDDK